MGGNRRVARRAGAWASIALGVGLLIGATAAPSSAAPSKDGAGKALLQKIVQNRLANRAAAAAALPRSTASKPLTVSPHTGLKNNTAVQVSAPSGTFKANDAPLVAVECNPDPSIPQDGSGCTAAKFLTGASAGNASGGVNTFSFTVKEGKIGSNSKAYCPPTAAQKSAGYNHCVISVSEPSPTGVHAAQDITFASETAPATGGTKTTTGGTTSSSGSSSSGSSSSGSSSSGSSSTSGTTSGLPSTGAPYELELLLAAACFVVGFVLLRFAPTVKPERSGAASTTTSSPSRT